MFDCLGFKEFAAKLGLFLHYSYFFSLEGLTMFIIEIYAHNVLFFIELEACPEGSH
jgi:hypothetical protein